MKHDSSATFTATPLLHPRHVPNLCRWIGVVAAMAMGLATERFPHALELLYVLKFLALVVVSVFCGTWPLLLALELALGIAWLVVVRRRSGTLPSRLIVDVNRLVGHVEALGPLLVLAMVLDVPAWLRFGTVATLVAFGPRLLDIVVAEIHERRYGTPPTGAWIRRARRLPMYIVTVTGMLFLAALAPLQWRALAPSGLAVVVGMALRLWATFTPASKRSGLSDRQWHQLTDVAMALAVVVAAGYGAWILARPPEGLWLTPRISAGQCAPEPTTPPVIATWLIGDTQFHELRGQRSAAHLPMVDAVVPVAVRPVALDLLSGVTLDQFAHLFQTYARSHPGTQLTWAHLGDLGDIGCSTELARYPDYFARFGTRKLAGIASGNHDNTFVGNFLWHPDWDTACTLNRRVHHGRGTEVHEYGHRLDKTDADAALHGLVQQFGQPGVQVRPTRGWAAWVEGRSALPMVSQLGTLPGQHGQAARPVMGVFLDSGDSALLQFGVAGVTGHVSQKQLDAVAGLVPADAWIVVFVHHPLAALGTQTRARLATQMQEWGSRLLLVVSAHTHVALYDPASPLGDGTVPEFTIGSAIDPTQESAVLEIRGDAQAPEVRVVTVPAVQRAGMDCSTLSDVDTAQCEPLLASLATDCTVVDHDDWFLKLHQPDEMTAHQAETASKLFTCMGIASTGDPLDPEVYTAWARRDELFRKRLLCVSWAASLLQGRKGAGWRYVDALRCVGERSATLGGLAVRVR